MISTNPQNNLWQKNNRAGWGIYSRNSPWFLGMEAMVYVSFWGKSTPKLTGTGHFELASLYIS